MVMKRKSWLQKHRAWLKSKKFEKAPNKLRRMTQHIGDIELLPAKPAPAPAIEVERMLVELSIERILGGMEAGDS